MGGAVKSITKSVGKIVSKVPGGKKLGSTLQGDVLDPLRGKYSVGKGHVVNESAFISGKDQKQLGRQLQVESLRAPDVSNSIAQQQLNQATNRNVAQIAGRVNAARGPNQTLALREGMRAQGAANQEAAGQSGILRAQEYQNALQNQANTRNMQLQNLAREQQALQNREQLKADIAGATQAQTSAANLYKAEGTKNLIQDVTSSAAKFFGMSDERIKKDVKPAHLEEIMTKLNAKKFSYKQPNGESYQDGTVTGIMAQDLEKSKLGKEMVSEIDGVKSVDLKKAVPVTMAAVSEIMKRIKKLESNKKSEA